MDVVAKLQNIFRDVFDDDTITITREMAADDVEEWDSLTHFQLIMQIESEFQVKFTTEEIVGFKSVGDIIDLIIENVSEGDSL